MSDAGLPPPDEWFGLDALRRWPLGAGYAELVRGRAVWAGPWDERDVATAQICFPDGRCTSRAATVRSW